MPRSPQLDYYIGRTVTDVAADEQGFTILLDGEVLIVVEDENAPQPAPEMLEGCQLLTLAMSESETRMLFGEQVQNPVTNQLEQTVRVTVAVSPTKYRIADRQYEGGPYYPQRPQEELRVPPEPLPVEDTLTMEEPTPAPPHVPQESTPVPPPDVPEMEARERAVEPSDGSEAPEQG
jgi:hypothetical protein